MRRVALILLLVAAAVPAAQAAGSAASPAHLAVSGTRALTVRGRGFHPHERIRLVVRATARPAIVRRVVASASGSFVVVGLAVPPGGPCRQVTVTASGALGSRATPAGTKHPDCTAG